MEPYGQSRVCIELYLKPELHRSMHKTTWAQVNHVVPRIELQGNLMNSDPFQMHLAKKIKVEIIPESMLSNFFRYSKKYLRSKAFQVWSLVNLRV